MLSEITQAQRFGFCGVAAIEIFLASKNAKESGFPRAVWTDDPDMLPFIDSKLPLIKKYAGTVGLISIDDLNQVAHFR